jgi:hypothetical protein
MKMIEIRQNIHQKIDQLSLEQLALMMEFLEFLEFKSAASHTSAVLTTSLNQSGDPVLTGSTIADLLQVAGTWKGNDFEDCLQSVYEARLPAEF